MTTILTLHGFVCNNCEIMFFVDTVVEDEDKITCPVCNSDDTEPLVGEERHNIQITIKGIEREKW